MADKSTNKTARESRKRTEKSPAPSPQLALADRAWKIAQLAATLARNFELQGHNPQALKTNPRIAQKDFDPYFAEALKRADTLLAWAEGKGGEVHAYQIFAEGEILTEAKIADRFKEVNWADIKTKLPVTKLMERIRQLFDEELKFQTGLFFGGTDTNATLLATSMESAIWDVFRGHFNYPSEDLPLSAQRFIADLTITFHEMVFEEFSGESKLKYRYLHQKEEFLKWCFPDPKEQETATRADYLYRPHEIFRHCATQNWLSDKLVKPREWLFPTFVPYPPADLQQEKYALFTRAYESRLYAIFSSKPRPNPLPLVSALRRKD